MMSALAMDITSANSSAGAAAPNRPQRPFTEYNVFFQLEREYLLQSQENGPSNGAYTIKKILAQEREVESPEMAALRPPRYQHLILPADWYVVGSKYTGKGDPTSYRRDRKHRKTHGVITFVELTKLVSSKWKVVDPETKEYCRNIAQGEFKRYRKELDEFIKIYGADAAKGKKRKPRQSKSKKVTPKMQPVEPQLKEEVAEPDLFGGTGECAFIPIDDDLDDDILGIEPLHSAKKKKRETLSNVTADGFEASRGDGMVDFPLYAPNRLSKRCSVDVGDNSTLQDHAPCEMNPITPSYSHTPHCQRVSLQDVMGRSLSLPFNDTNCYSDGPSMMTQAATSNAFNSQGRSIDMNFGNVGFSQQAAIDRNMYFGGFGFQQVTGADLDRFVYQYGDDISRDMTQQRLLELQRQLYSQQQRQVQRYDGEIQNCLEQLYLLQFHKQCVLNGGRRVSMDDGRRGSMDLGLRVSMDRNRRSSMDTAFNRSSINNGYRRSSLPLPMPKPKTVQAAPPSLEFPQLSLKQEYIIKSLAEQEKLRKSLQVPADKPNAPSISKGSSQEWDFGKTPLSDLSENPSTNCPTAA